MQTANKKQDCKACRGTGKIRDKAPCYLCRGTGKAQGKYATKD